ncbi:COP23 domain-containing protein [Oscillatoria laete-virens NRMC-F 0139]|nr:COP23 domain-containing protein [Oscillatoria laete-virens]MDL5051977.1 COP23 domain-containing protein [Oscillatoria laete-virens NRMC-F 0139]
MVVLKTRFHWLLTAALTVACVTQARQASAQQLTCKRVGSGFQIFVNNGPTSLLTIQDTLNIKQSCQQIANKLEQEINIPRLETLMLVADSIGRQDSICVVRSHRGACRYDRSNLLIAVPEGRDRSQFLDDILTIRTDTFFSGYAGQHTNRRYYAKLGKTLISLSRQR